MTEEKLIEQCRKGRREAQKMVWEKYESRMFRVCYRYLREQQEAEDVLIEGFYKALTGMQQFEYRGADSLEKWLRRIMVNECLMRLRKKRISWSSEGGEAVPDESPLPTGNFDAEKIYACIRELPDGYRTVFNLAVIEGYSHAEIAKELGITEGTSKSQLSKARVLLQKQLTHKGFTYEHVK